MQWNSELEYLNTTETSLNRIQTTKTKLKRRSQDRSHRKNNRILVKKTKERKVHGLSIQSQFSPDRYSFHIMFIRGLHENAQGELEHDRDLKQATVGEKITP